MRCVPLLLRLCSTATLTPWCHPRHSAPGGQTPEGKNSPAAPPLGPAGPIAPPTVAHQRRPSHKGDELHILRKSQHNRHWQRGQALDEGLRYSGVPAALCPAVPFVANRWNQPYLPHRCRPTGTPH
mmetsp:Transcript_46847/g.78613  ORF Transcript_46847/g.78613 Transcript_46847/m.78613 type:complete len:126 (-) Transcript_46847:303-680(-)